MDRLRWVIIGTIDASCHHRRRAEEQAPEKLC